MTIYTIGFTQKSAAQFFEIIRECGAKRLVDIRLHNRSQLAGFTKRNDLEYFLNSILGVDYVELGLLAPEDWFLKEYRRTRDWEIFSERYLTLLGERHIPDLIPTHVFEDDVILLCSEPKAERCHRRLAAEFLAGRVLPGARIQHL